jgi:hypothetical protein
MEKPAENESKLDKEKDYQIIINAREKLWLEHTITFQQVVTLAFGIMKESNNTSYTVTYLRGNGNKPEGSMVNGDAVKVKDKMIFNVTATNKS